MRTRYGFYNVAQQSLRNLCTTTIYNTKNHYDSLGITPKASQKDVKDAYYKLSKLYHPDKNEGSEEASKKFRQVSEAYEVLGNIKLRKLYDRGLFLKGRLILVDEGSILQRNTHWQIFTDLENEEQDHHHHKVEAHLFMTLMNGPGLIMVPRLRETCITKIWYTDKEQQEQEKQLILKLSVHLF
ncbi:diphthamide biosynthesis protein 4 [Agrilus planipennis]|uniref:Diphthamide biosynthesis protein 4 n=1 Tax=Agrilus planipennis TaxID=224129 RepID=A0A1W4W308_AGRPL|nr:diphthamide biosynthesis protein 4 [Agrilus planipennis]